MTVNVGYRGAFRFARTAAASVAASVSPADVITSLARVGVEDIAGEILTGDQVSFSTADPRGLAFLPANTWASGQVESQGTFYVNVNSNFAFRLFRTFQAAVSNDRNLELPVAAFSGEPIPVSLAVRDSRYRTLARVESYTFNTDRDALDTTSLHEGSRSSQSGLVNASGSLQLLFDFRLLPSESDLEVPIAIVQTVSRLKSGSRFESLLYIREPQEDEDDQVSVFYQFAANITRAGITGQADDIVRASVEFAVTGDYYLKIGTPPSYLLQEAGDRFQLEEQEIGYLLQEVND